MKICLQMNDNQENIYIIEQKANDIYISWKIMMKLRRGRILFFFYYY